MRTRAQFEADTFSPASDLEMVADTVADVLKLLPRAKIVIVGAAINADAMRYFKVAKSEIKLQLSDTPATEPCIAFLFTDGTLKIN